MLSQFYSYLSVLSWKAITAALFMNGVASLLGRYWRPIDVPKRILWTLTIIVVFGAGFQAWNEEHGNVEALRKNLSEREQKLAIAHAENERLAHLPEREELAELQSKLRSLEAKGPRTLTRTLALSGKEVVASSFIPPGVVRSVTGHVDAQITGATGWSLGFPDDRTCWAFDASTLAGTHTTAADFQVVNPDISMPFATDVIITAVGGAFTGGQVTLTVIYDPLEP